DDAVERLNRAEIDLDPGRIDADRRSPPRRQIGVEGIGCRHAVRILVAAGRGVALKRQVDTRWRDAERCSSAGDGAGDIAYHHGITGGVTGLDGRYGEARSGSAGNIHTVLLPLIGEG